MDELRVLSNKNGNFSWWGRGSDEKTFAELRAPSSYLEIQTKQFFSTNHLGLFLFCTQAGQSCCLVCSIPSGLIAGILVQDSILITGSDGSITPAMRGLASLYLADPPLPSETAALEIDPPSSLERIVALIERQGRDVTVRWTELEERLRETAVETGAIPEGRFLRRDTTEARRNLAKLIAGTSSMDPGEVLVAVSSGLFPSEVAQHGVRWALTDDETQGWEAPLEGSASPRYQPPPPRASAGDTYSSTPAQKQPGGPNWLLWMFLASLVVASVAAAASIGWKRH